MINEEQIEHAARTRYFERTSVMIAECSRPDMVIGFVDGAKWALEQSRWIGGCPDDDGVYVFAIEFMCRNLPMRQILIGSISQETGELLDHDGNGTGWDTATEVITHYVSCPELPKQ